MEGLLRPTHLIIILVIVLVLFGPGKLPELGKGLGKGIREFKDALRGGLNQSAGAAEAPKADAKAEAPKEEAKVAETKT